MIKWPSRRESSGQRLNGCRNRDILKGRLSALNTSLFYQVCPIIRFWGTSLRGSCFCPLVWFPSQMWLVSVTFWEWWEKKNQKKNGLIWHCVRDCRHLRLQNQLARVWVSGSSDGQNSSRRILSEMNGFRETCSPLSTHLIRTTLVHKSSVSTPSGCFPHFLTPGQKGE